MLAASVSALAEDPAGPVSPAFSPSLVYNGALFTNLAGGLARRSTYSGNLDLRLTVDLDRLAGWRRTTFYVDGLWIQGGQPSNIVGDTQGVSNISAPNTAQLEEIWVQTDF